jgi:DNA repair ATPase RecN
MKTNRQLLAAVLALPLAFSAPAFAQDGEGEDLSGESGRAATPQEVAQAFDQAVAQQGGAAAPQNPPAGEAARIQARIADLDAKYDGVKGKFAACLERLALLRNKYDAAVANNAPEEFVREIKIKIANDEKAADDYKSTLNAIIKERDELTRQLAALPAPGR